MELQFCLTNLCLEQCNKHAVFVFKTHKLISQNIKTTCLKLFMHVWLVALKCWSFRSCEEWGGTSIQQALGMTDAQIDLGHGEFRGWLSITPTCSLLCFELTEPFFAMFTWVESARITTTWTQDQGFPVEHCSGTRWSVLFTSRCWLAL